MRELVLDTETTGFDPESGDRIVEIGAVELINHVPTGRTYHQYINPERNMPADAFAVHGISEEFLSDKPVFKKIALDFLSFVDGAHLVIHNAAFDMKFLNAELRWAEHPQLDTTRVVDTLEIARRKYPGAQNSLDALCRRFAVDNSAREKHGALLDSEILAEVYLELIGGRQPGFHLGVVANVSTENSTDDWTPPARPRELEPRLTEKEKAAHAAFLDDFPTEARWRVS